MPLPGGNPNLDPRMAGMLNTRPTPLAGQLPPRAGQRTGQRKGRKMGRHHARRSR
jgi:hypothetical protein